MQDDSSAMKRTRVLILGVVLAGMPKPAYSAEFAGAHGPGSPQWRNRSRRPCRGQRHISDWCGAQENYRRRCVAGYLRGPGGGFGDRLQDSFAFLGTRMRGIALGGIL